MNLPVASNMDLGMSVSTGSNPPLVPFTDRNLVVYLIFKGKTWKQRYKMSIHKTIFYFAREEIEELVAFWQSGQPIPVADFRDIIKAEQIFNAAVHDEI